MNGIHEKRLYGRRNSFRSGANVSENIAIMPQTPSRSPQNHNGSVPPQSFTPQTYNTTPTVPSYEQMYHYGMYVPIVNPYGGSPENGSWYPQQFNPNYQPYYHPGQPSLDAPLPLQAYPINFNYNSNYYDHSMRDASPPRK